ncbi:hypothetical protein Tco_0570104 [Tanacetum coccineum]
MNKVGSIVPLLKPLDTKNLESSSYHALGAYFYPESGFLNMGDIEVMMIRINDYLTRTRNDNGPRIVKPQFKENIKFEFWGQCIKEFKENVFFGRDNEDSHEHIRRIIEIIDMFHVPGVSNDHIMAMGFPVTLKGKAMK